MARFFQDGQWVTGGDDAAMPAGGFRSVDEAAEFDPGSALNMTGRGYISSSGWKGSDINWEHIKGAPRNFSSEDDYFNWLYGGGSYMTDDAGNQWFKPITGRPDAYAPGAAPISFNAPTDPGWYGTLAAIAAMTGAGAMEGAFSGAASNAGWTSGFDLAGGGGLGGFGQLGSGTFGIGAGELGAGAAEMGLSLASDPLAAAAAGFGGLDAGAAATSAFNPAAYISSGVLPSGAVSATPLLPGGGGMMDEMLRKLLEQAGLGASPLSAGMSIASGLFGLKKSSDIEALARQAAAQQDPFGPQRAQYAQRLNDLYANPSSVANLPGYKAGLDAVERKMASQGYIGSGNMMLALQDYGGNAFNAEATRLAQLAGANFAPSGGDALLRGGIASTDAISRALASLGYGARQIEQILRGA